MQNNFVEKSYVLCTYSIRGKEDGSVLSLDGPINVNVNITHFLEHRSLMISVQKYLKGKWINTTDSKISHSNMPLMVSTGIANKQGSKNIYDRLL